MKCANAASDMRTNRRSLFFLANFSPGASVPCAVYTAI